MEFKEYKGKNVDEAITNACIDLGIEAAKLEYEVIEKSVANLQLLRLRKISL